MRALILIWMELEWKLESCSKEQASTHSGTHGYQYGYTGTSIGMGTKYGYMHENEYGYPSQYPGTGTSMGTRVPVLWVWVLDLEPWYGYWYWHLGTGTTTLGSGVAEVFEGGKFGPFTHRHCINSQLILGENGGGSKAWLPSPLVSYTTTSSTLPKSGRGKIKCLPTSVYLNCITEKKIFYRRGGEADTFLLLWPCITENYKNYYTLKSYW